MKIKAPVMTRKCPFPLWRKDFGILSAVECPQMRLKSRIVTLMRQENRTRHPVGEGASQTDGGVFEKTLKNYGRRAA
jgi:hypothetical protein